MTGGLSGQKVPGKGKGCKHPTTKNNFETYWFSNTPLGQRPGEFYLIASRIPPGRLMGRVDDSKVRRFGERSTRRIGDKSPPEAPKSTPNHPRRLQNRPPNRFKNYLKTKKRPRGVPEGQKVRFLNVPRALLAKNVSPRGSNGPRKRPPNRQNRYQKSTFLSRGSRRPFWSVLGSKMR